MSESGADILRRREHEKSGLLDSTGIQVHVFGNEISVPCTSGACGIQLSQSNVRFDRRWSIESKRLYAPSGQQRR